MLFSRGSLLVLLHFFVVINCRKNPKINIVTGYDAIESAKTLTSHAKIKDLFAKAVEPESKEELKTVSYSKDKEGYKGDSFLTSESSGHCSILNGGTRESYSMQKEARTAMKAYEDLTKADDYSANNRYMVPQEKCRSATNPYKCDPSETWRSIDGTCNNLYNPWWGAAPQPYQRFAKPAYDDGLNAPRCKGVDGSHLPNPRKIAMYVHSPYQTKSDWSHLFVWFGQFVLHDVGKTASIVNSYGDQKWCKCGEKWSSDPDCFNIPIPYEDYWNKDQKCFAFTRSSPAVRYDDCYLGPREQLNLVTSWVDLSQVYGNDLKTSRKLRTYEKGLLKVSYNKYSRREHLPKRENVADCMGLKTLSKCYQAGDGRHEDNGYLNSLHTIFVREHNRVARQLYYWNPTWDDETTFQEARRVVIAEYQNIVYAEFLPLLVGQDVARQFDLLPSYQGYFMGYDWKINPNTQNEFTFAGRYGHTLCKNWQLRADKDYETYSNKTIDYYIFNPKLPEYGGGIDSLVRAALADFAYYPTSQVNDKLNNWLAEDVFYKETGNKRFSLPALNIQRGRDHGVAAYVVYRDLCGLGRAYSFEDLKNIPRDVVSQLRKVYKSVEDIDLWTGLTSEYPLEGAAVGATGACILAKGFRDWKYGDRWWFENGQDPAIAFTPPQLDEIKSTSLARLICDNVDTDYVQNLALLWPDEKYNPWMDCKKIAGINFAAWQEVKYNKPY